MSIPWLKEKKKKIILIGVEVVDISSKLKKKVVWGRELYFGDVSSSRDVCDG